MQALARLGHEKTIRQSDFSILEEFIGSIYGATKLHCKRVDEARIKLLRKTAPKKLSNKFTNIKSVHPAMLPSCFKLLRETEENKSLSTSVSVCM